MVGFDGIQPLLLKFVGPQFLLQSDATTFLWQIHNGPGSLIEDHLHRHVQLITAVTAQRVEDIAGETGRVHANQWRCGCGQISPH